MARLRTDVIRDVGTDVTTVRAHGVLDLRTASDMRAILLKVIGDCPAAVVVDVSDCTVAHRSALSVFPAVLRHFALQPLVAMSLGGVHPSFLSYGGRVILGPVPAYASTGSAVAAVAETRSTQQRVIFSPRLEPEAPAQARKMIGEACHRWGRPELETAAALVVSELVTNAIMHAHGPVLMEGALRGAFIHLRVHDGSTREPVLGLPLEAGDPLRDHGRGLRLIERHCAGWGFVLRADGSGKVVWATLRARPIGSP
ncbi:MAG: ATP-binding protein [Betaproteobacteria bacterium]